MKQRPGILGLASAALFAIVAVISALTFENGAYSPLNCFVTELGAYPEGYMAVSPALAFNIGLILCGLLLGAFMLLYGIRNAGVLHTASSFFGVACGVLLAAQGVITLNYPSFHIILSAAFFVSALLMCALLAAANFRTGGFWPVRILTPLTGAASAICATYVISGGVSSVFAEDLLAARILFMPFAALQWVSYLLFFALIVLMSAKMMAKEKP